MMLQPVEKLEGTPTGQRTREQARELLEGLRMAYQSLSPSERGLMKSIVWQLGRAQPSKEFD